MIRKDIKEPNIKGMLKNKKVVAVYMG